MHISVAQFHENWQYELYRFNCEHWARLVTTGDCRCFQITEFKKLQKIPVVGVAIVGIAEIVTGAWEHTALPVVMRYKILGLREQGTGNRE
ncbi:MAG: hypothetical protein AAGJ08_03130 [Cyanobacteria bacterium P01_H01_bin.35]